MFGLIKWSITFLVLGTIVYLANFFWFMDQDSIEKVKKDTVVAIESGDSQAVIGPLSDQMKEDLKNKKISAMEYFKAKVKESLHRLID